MLSIPGYGNMEVLASTNSIDNNHYLYYRHETCTLMRIEHDTHWSSRMTPYLHPHLQMTQKKGNSDTTDKARNYDRHYLYCGHSC